MADHDRQLEALSKQDELIAEFSGRSRKEKKPQKLTILQLIAAGAIYLIMVQFGDPLLKLFGIEDGGGTFRSGTIAPLSPEITPADITGGK